MWEKIVKDNMLQKEVYLASYACKSSDAIRMKKDDEDFRPSFARDVDRIIYSLAYTRYMDKTQVFYHDYNDHVTKRMTHVQMVSKIARTIGRALKLNEDFIEAAALGHDLGHVPFGHEGEYILDEISLRVGEGHFHHNIQSVRDLMVIENYGKGLNISLQVLDAIMCHNGEFLLDEYYPVEKDMEEFLDEYESSYHDHEKMKHYIPMTLEGCVVRVSDVIAYIGRDIEDAIRFGLLKREDIPKEISDVLGNTTSEIVNTIVSDVIYNSLDKPYLKMTPSIFEAVVALKKFNSKNIYQKSLTEEEKENLRNDFELLFYGLLQELKEKDTSSPLISSYMSNMSEEYCKNNSEERIVIDYMAGMTDDFFRKQVERLKNKKGL